MASEKITQDKIINAVLSCAFEKSTGATSLSDIADKLGIKKASLYNHFENREAIIDAAVKHCAEVILKTAFIPPEMDATAQKYSAEVVIKGIVNRWFKMNTKDPLFQIYAFLQSEKYFSTSAAKAYMDSQAKLNDQSIQALKALANAGKIKALTDDQLKTSAELLVSSMTTLLDARIILKKSELRFNPAAEDDDDYSDIDALVFRFCELLK